MLDLYQIYMYICQNTEARVKPDTILPWMIWVGEWLLFFFLFILSALSCLNRLLG